MPEPIRSMSGEAERPAVVLYRCRTPTNWLCPCGAVERRLRKLGIEHRTERASYPRSARLEIEELTGQHRVPVLVDGDEVIHDSKRILQYLDWKHGGRAEAEPGSDDPGLYNVVHDGDTEGSDHPDRQGGREDQGAHRR